MIKTLITICLTTVILVNVSAQSKPLNEILSDLSKQNSINILYNSEEVNDIIRENSNEPALGDQLRSLLSGTGLVFLYQDDKDVFILPAELFNNYSITLLNINRTPDEYVTDDLSISDIITADAVFTISGVIADSKTNEPLIGASIIVNNGDEEKYAISDVEGKYQLEVNPGRYSFKVLMSGFQQEESQLAVFTDLNKNVAMYEETMYLDEFTITANKSNSASSTESSTMQLSVESIKKLPPAFGEVDVIKSISSLPGVSNVGEDTSGFNVRGGNIDQNLILLDGAPVYNSGHLFGFFSIFNPDALDGFKLYKGAIPSSYGGRASSVLTISLKNPAMEELNFGGSVGILTSKLRVETPISKKHGISFLAAGRIAYPNFVMSQSIEQTISQSSASYSDVTAKLSYKPSDKDFALSSSLYLSQDEFSFRPDTVYGWDNQIANLDFSKSFGTHFFNTHIHYSNYTNKITGNYTNSEYDYNSSVNDIGLKAVLAKDDELGLSYETGLEVKRIKLNLGEIEPSGDQSSILPYETGVERGLEGAIFAEASKQINQKLSLTAGLRYSMFARLGESSEYTYMEGFSKDPRRITDTTFYSSGQLYGFNSGLEPRISGKITLTPKSSFKFSYNLLRQYLLLVSNTAAQSPVDIWKLSGPNLQSQLNHIWSVGYYREIDKPDLNVSVELYYKLLKNNIGYKEGAQLTLNNSLETELINGVGNSYGMEFLINKTEGKSTGWISYTYSRSFNKLDGPYRTERINNGEFFPSNFDKPHILNFIYNYDFNSRLSSSVNFVYNSGRPITAPESAYYFNGSIIANYQARNQERVPDYHRLDLSLTLENRKKRSRDWETSWTFSVYNVYGRNNPFSVYFSTIRDGRLPQAYKLSVLGSIIPAITFNFDLK